jgi:hypothetical protein
VVGKATSGREVEAAFAMFVQRRLGRYYVGGGPFFNSQRERIHCAGGTPRASRDLCIPRVRCGWTVRSRACLSNKTALAMIFKLAQAAEKSWHRLRGHNQLPKVILGVKFNHGIEVVRSQAQAAAA